MSSRVPLPTPSPAEGLHRVCVAIRYGREHSTGLKFEPLVEVRGLPVCAPALIKGGLRNPQDLSRQVLIHLTTQPHAWPAWLKQAGIPQMIARGQLWLDSVPAMLEAAEQGLGVTLAMAPLIRARPGFGKKLVAAFDIAASPTETIYLVSRTEQARDRRIGALRRMDRGCGQPRPLGKRQKRPPVRISRTISRRTMAPIAE
jgi:LysR family transcriptional regulator, glycine cleavage system transcriptional activator